ncbi:MAG TPA: glycosyltransferase family 4 protein [Candidatus Bathyarchaeia archaeon]|nr:glycosyltransferase family 4 protein [Candidatus Bathyarchaeia archaeon]
MKICMVTDTYHPIFDGIVRYLDYLIPELVKKGHHVTLVCPHFPGCKRRSSPFEGFEIVRSLNTRLKVNAYYFALPDWRLIRAIRSSDIVILHSLMPLGVAGGLIAKLFRKKVGLFCHHDERVILHDIVKAKPFFVRFCFKLISKFYSKIVDVFFHATERFKKKLLFFAAPPEKIYHTPFAINKNSFHPSPVVNLRVRYDLPEEAIVATYLGRLSVEKNVDTIIQALDLAMDEHPNLFALIVGGGPDKEKFISQSKSNTDRFIFTGFIPEKELHSHYTLSDIFVTPTLNESSCFTVFEAMSCQVPVITAEKDHDPDIIHKENALLITDVLDSHEIKDNILLLANDVSLRDHIALQGHYLIDNRTWENHADKFLFGLDEIQQESFKESKRPDKTSLQRFPDKSKDRLISHT